MNTYTMQIVYIDYIYIYTTPVQSSSIIYMYTRSSIYKNILVYINQYHSSIINNNTELSSS